MRDRSRALFALSLAASTPLLSGAALPMGEVRATVTDLRSVRGQVLACLTAQPEAFPQCERDPEARTLTLPARAGMELDFGPVPAGRYAIALIHDENGNGKLDKRLIIPREGFGFSRDAPVRLGPPDFADAAFTVGGGDLHQTIRMRYLF